MVELSFPFNQLSRSLGVIDDRFDLAAVAHDALVIEQTLNVWFGETRDRVEFEIVECRPEVLALGKNCAPAQPGLKAFK